MSNYKLSIIIPTFNLEKRIQDTFNSIKSQSIGFENIEVIFVDDNSTDNTFKTICDYSKTYENVKIFKTNENSGFAGKPRNIGLEKSTSEHILFLDGDDQLLIDSCDVLLKNITMNDADISIGAHINRYENGILEHITPLYIGNKEVFENTEDLQLLDITPAISAKLFKKELLIKNGITFATGIPGQDLIFLLESVLNSNKIAVMNNQYIYYRLIHNKSISYKINEKYLLGLIKAYSKICDIFQKHSVDINIQEMILKKHLGFLTSQISRAIYYDSLNNDEINNILNSDLFKELSEKDIFKNNQKFDLFFQNMSDGEYNKAKQAINNLKLNIDKNTNYLDFKNESNRLMDKLETIREHNTLLTEQNNNINNKYIDLEKEFNNIEKEVNELNKSNSNLIKENSMLTNELNEIKSSRLWKLKNIFD